MTSKLMSRLPLLAGLVAVLWPLTSGLTPAGCDDDWVDLGLNCYYFGVDSLDNAAARVECEMLGANLTSLWTNNETQFIASTLWPRQLPITGLAWTGLYGTASNAWAWRDKSAFAMATPGAPSIRYNTCGALNGNGQVVYIDCSTIQDGYICKKALPKLYASSALVERTVASSLQASQPRHLLFERVWPPLLGSIKTNLTVLQKLSVISETSCAYHCFNANPCKAFQATCVSTSTCVWFTCILYSQA